MSYPFARSPSLCLSSSPAGLSLSPSLPLSHSTSLLPSLPYPVSLPLSPSYTHTPSHTHTHPATHTHTPSPPHQELISRVFVQLLYMTSLSAAGCVCVCGWVCVRERESKGGSAFVLCGGLLFCTGCVLWKEGDWCSDHSRNDLCFS